MHDGDGLHVIDRRPRPSGTSQTCLILHLETNMDDVVPILQRRGLTSIDTVRQSNQRR